MGGNGAHSRTDRRIGPQCGFFGGCRFDERVHDSPVRSPERLAGYYDE
jgi:hypothetical protein